jgi:hypothetical protein
MVVVDPPPDLPQLPAQSKGLASSQAASLQPCETGAVNPPELRWYLTEWYLTGLSYAGDSHRALWPGGRCREHTGWPHCSAG